MEYEMMRPEGTFDEYIARFGPDGTLKHQALLLENIRMTLSNLREYKESPLQYYQWDGISDNDLAIYVMDSLFHKNLIVISTILSEEVLDSIHTAYEYLDFDAFTQVIPLDGEDVLVAGVYVRDTSYMNCTTEYGTAVARYDLRTMQRKDLVVFNDYPGDNSVAQCMGFKMMSDRTVYFLYKERGYPDESLMAVKMDTDLNVEWKRFLKTDNINIVQPLAFPDVHEEEQEENKGIGWFGHALKDGDEKRGFVYFFLNHDGTIGTNEGSIEVRPYAFYPNPAKDQLHMSYSPDVQPKQIELHDLQGRLVHTQRSGLERIDMSRLPAGTYTLRVMMEDGKIYSDKVVKE